MTKVIAVANQKGGVGKTTTTVNCSAALALQGKRVLAVDVDPQGNSTSGLGLDKTAGHISVYDVLVNGAPIESAVLPTQVEGLFAIPSAIKLAGAEVEMVGMPGREYIVKNAIDAIRKEYDYVLMDCPPSLGLLTVNALTAADTVLVPIQCEYYALEGVTQLVDTIRLVKKHLNPGLDIEGVLLTMFDPRTRLSMQVVDEVKAFFKHKVFSSLVPRNVRLGEAPSFGKPIMLYDAQCAGARAYEYLAEEIIEKNKEVAV
ncbi:MAG: ParA family protein [Bacillota bacterium]